MERTFSVSEAIAMLAEAAPVVNEILACRAELAERLHALEQGDRQQLPEVKGLEARLGEQLDWFTSRGVQVKGYAPLLLDWPHERRRAPPAAVLARERAGAGLVPRRPARVPRPAPAERAVVAGPGRDRYGPSRSAPLT